MIRFVLPGQRVLSDQLNELNSVYLSSVRSQLSPLARISHSLPILRDIKIARGDFDVFHVV